MSKVDDLSGFTQIPDRTRLYPLDGHSGVFFPANLELPPHVEVGDYTYYDDPKGPKAFLENVYYHFDFTGDWLRIGKFCALACGTKFIMNGGNHRTDAFSTYPFMIFGGDWANRFPGEAHFPMKGDTLIGNDVWTGWNSVIMPGVTVGHGAIVAACSVVTKDVPPYAVVAGNPAQVVRMRFDNEVVNHLLRLAWWDWDVEKITERMPVISGTDKNALLALAPPDQSKP